MPAVTRHSASSCMDPGELTGPGSTPGIEKPIQGRKISTTSTTSGTSTDSTRPARGRPGVPDAGRGDGPVGECLGEVRHAVFPVRPAGRTSSTTASNNTTDTSPIPEYR